MEKLTPVPDALPPPKWLFTAECPNWIFVAVRNGDVVVESYCGRFFEWAERETNDLHDIVTGLTWADALAGFYVLEGHVAIKVPHSTDRPLDWDFDRIRLINDEEWARYQNGDEIWDPVYIDAEFAAEQSPFVALLEAAQGWLTWRRHIEIEASSAEATLIEAIHAVQKVADDPTPG